MNIILERVRNKAILHPNPSFTLMCFPVFFCFEEGGWGHFSRTGLAAGLQQPTRESWRAGPDRGAEAPAPCLALLRVGFT